MERSSQLTFKHFEEIKFESILFLIKTSLSLSRAILLSFFAALKDHNY